MDQDLWTEVDGYLAGRVIPPPEALDFVLEATAAAGMPAISVSATQGRLLQVLARSVRARAILEIGTLGGYSTIWLARALAPGGRLVTLEKDPMHAAVASSNIARAGFADVVELRVGDALDSLAQLNAEERGPFDMVFIDADKPNIPAYFEWALSLTRSGSLIMVDNVVRDGDVKDAGSADPSTVGVRRFLDMLADSSRVTGTAIQTVGTKGYDGFALAVVN